MNRTPGGNNLRTHRFRNDLHTQAYSEDGDAAGKCRHHIGADSGLIRPERPWRENDSLRMEGFNFAERNAIRAVDNTLPARSFYSLH